MKRMVFTEQQIGVIIDNYQSGINVSKIAKQLDISTAPILRILRENNIRIRTGVEIQRKLFSKDDCLKICEEYKNGITINKLASKYKVNRETIRRYLINNGLKTTKAKVEKVPIKYEDWTPDPKLDDKMSNLDPGKIGVYIITFPKGEFYIGSGGGKRGIFGRWKAHKRGYVNSPQYLQEVANKYGGWNNKSIYFTILENVSTRELALSREQDYINRFWGNPLLLNKSKSVTKAPEMKGENHPLYGKHHSEKSRQKISENHADFSGENNSRSKLTWKIVEEIRSKYKPRIYTLKMLSEEYNININTLINVIYKHNWIKK